MRSRSRFLLLAPVLACTLGIACGCGDYDDRYSSRNQNDILFGIRQKVGPDGTKDVAASYEFLGLANKGGWSALVFRDGDGEGTCYFERYDQRLGRPRVENGVATFSGGKIPAPGLQILANQPEPSTATDGWATDDTLTFSAAGFAMPAIPTSTMKAPATELTIGAITPAPVAIQERSTPEEIALAPTDDVAVTWTATEEKVPTRVMISLETDESEPGGPDVPGGNVRCFNSAKAGSAIIPRDWVARLFSSVDPAKPIKGRLEIATHRQLTIHGRSRWTVYVVATSRHREIAFTGSR